MLSVAGPTIGAMPAIASLAGLPVISAGVTRPSTALSWVGRSSQPSGPSDAVASLATTNETITNLLPMAPCHLSLPWSGIHAGEGLPSVLSKLAEKIRGREFIEMSEMLPEFWTQARFDEAESKPPAARRCRRQVTEIFTWVQCFCTYVSVLSSKFPEIVPELMTYLVTITRVSLDFAGRQP